MIFAKGGDQSVPKLHEILSLLGKAVSMLDLQKLNLIVQKYTPDQHDHYTM